MLLLIKVQCRLYNYRTLWPLHVDFRDFGDGVCHVTKITVAESNPDIEPLTQQTFPSSLIVLARIALQNADIQIMTLSTASHLGLSNSL